MEYPVFHVTLVRIAPSGPTEAAEILLATSKTLMRRVFPNLQAGTLDAVWKRIEPDLSVEIGRRYILDSAIIYLRGIDIQWPQHMHEVLRSIERAEEDEQKARALAQDSALAQRRRDEERLELQRLLQEDQTVQGAMLTGVRSSMLLYRPIGRQRMSFVLILVKRG